MTHNLQEFYTPYANIYLALFVTSILYAVLLQIWSTHWPESFDDLTWLTVVIGVGYVLLFLGPILPLPQWMQVTAAFFVACIPIIARSIINAAHKRRLVNSQLENENDNDQEG